MKLIDADELHELFNWTFKRPPYSRKTVRKYINMARTVDAEPVRHGYWIMKPNGYGTCSCCKVCVLDILGGVDCNYCPNCGTKMDKEEREDGQTD